jgi:hypothetical protein
VGVTADHPGFLTPPPLERALLRLTASSWHARHHDESRSRGRGLPGNEFVGTVRVHFRQLFTGRVMSLGFPAI